MKDISRFPQGIYVKIFIRDTPEDLHKRCLKIFTRYDSRSSQEMSQDLHKRCLKNFTKDMTQDLHKRCLKNFMKDISRCPQEMFQDLQKGHASHKDLSQDLHKGYASGS